MDDRQSKIETHESVWIHDTARLYGHIKIAENASVWPYVVMRSEMHHIEIGPRSNIQDFVMVHVGGATPTIVGADCSITHHVTLHGCTIGDRCLIGINATIMDGAQIGDNSIVAGHAIVSENSVFPPNSIIAGAPAKVIKTRDNGAANAVNAAFYSRNAKNYAAGIHRLNEQDLIDVGLIAPK